MTLDIVLVLLVLLIALVLFVTERIKMDVVALLVLVSLAVAGLVTPAQALSGFSNPAVITVLAMFIISGGLTQTGVASLIGRQVLPLAGASEARLIAVIMITSGVMSAFMNNVGVAAMLLPVVMDIARRIGHSPSLLLMPLAFGSLLGGLTTLIGTPPNLLISDALRDQGLTPFGLFDYAPVGLIVMAVGIVYMLAVGRYLLPKRAPIARAGMIVEKGLTDLYDLRERFFTLRLPPDSPLAGKTLVESRLGTALQLNVVAIERNGRAQLAPRPEATLRGGDRLVVQGRPELLERLRDLHYQTVNEGQEALQKLLASEVKIAEVAIAAHSSLVGQSLLESALRQKYGVTALAIHSQQALRRTNFQTLPLNAGD